MSAQLFEGVNGDPMTMEEVRAVQGLIRLSRRWPCTLKLISMGGSLHVIHADDPRFSETLAVDRQKCVLFSFENIPNDGGDW